ncbi:MAG: hypothetical protein KGI60_03435 [Patescibacteria group bacterium]|nr:hypothetical protein [Patescibacteria group bacterium]
MGKKDAHAREVAKKVAGSLNSQSRRLKTARRGRLIKVVEALLEFKTDEQAAKWLLKKNRFCHDLQPIDLIGSEYATRELLKIIEQARDGVYS